MRQINYRRRQFLFVLAVAVPMSLILSIPTFAGAGWGFAVVGTIIAFVYAWFLLWLVGLGA